MTTRPRRGSHPARLLATALLFGVGWYGLELAGLALGEAGNDAPELARGALRFLPWHLLAFAAMGMGLALLGVLRPVSAAGAGWWVLFGAANLFLGVRVAEGALHAATLGVAVLRCAGLALAVGAAVLLLAALGRALPPRLRAGWPLAAWVGSSILLVGFLGSAGSVLALGELGPSEVGAYVRPAHAALAAAAALAVLALSALRTRPAAGPALLTVALLSLPAPLQAAPRLPDVYLFVLDTLRHDHLGARENGESATPALDRVAPEFFRFARAYSPSTRTSRAMPGIVTSLSARVVGSRLPAQATTLAERLRDAGFATFGLSANPQVSAAFGYEQGFDAFASGAGALDLQIVPVLKLLGSGFPGVAYELGVLGGELYYPPIDQLRRRTLRFLDSSAGPSFVHVQTMDVHGPYLPPRSFLPQGYRRGDFMSYYEFLRRSGTPELDSPALAPQLENLRQRYAGGVAYTDEVLAAWVEELRARGRWDEALVWIVSDHGEAFGEHGFAGHGYSYVGSPVVQVPLWLKLPRSSGLPPQRIDVPVSSYDLLPTTLALLGLPPVEPAFGVDLTPILQGRSPDRQRVVVVETDDGPHAALYAAVKGNWKLHVHYSGGVPDSRALYDLERDPGERVDRHAEEPGVSAALEAAIEERRRIEKALAFVQSGTKVDPATRAQLRSLGYAD